MVIIGAGNIGAFFDTPNSKNILTHAHAFKQHGGFNLRGFIDIDKLQAKKAAKLWDCQAFPSLREAFKQEKIDVIVVAASDEAHYDILKEISSYKIKLVVAEKPLTTTISEAKRIVDIYHQKNIPLVVNYTRRFVPELAIIQEKIKNKYYGEFIAGNAYYGKGLFHNGSHTIDLLRWFIGELKSSKIISNLNDFDPDDPSVTAILTFMNNKKLYLQAVDSHLYTVFETDLLFTRGRIVIERGSLLIEEYQITRNKLFTGYKNLIKIKSIESGRVQALSYLVDNVYNFLHKQEKLKCSLDEGYKTLLTCFKIRENIWIN